MTAARIIFIITLSFLSACGSVLTMEYDCNPAGATIYQNSGEVLGACPVSAQYPITQKNRADGYVILQGVTAAWISGARTSIPQIRANLSTGYLQRLLLDRPRNFPGYERDANFGLQINQMRAAQIQQQLQQQQIEMQNTINAIQRMNQPSTIMKCTTTKVLGSLETECR